MSENITSNQSKTIDNNLNQINLIKNQKNDTVSSETLELKQKDKKFIGITAIFCGIVLISLSILGPLFLNIIQYRTSQSGIIQTEAQDLSNLFLLAPLLIIGGIQFIKNKESGKHLLILTPVYLMYMGLSYGIGQEWMNPAYLGNVEKFFYLYLVLIIGGLVIMVGTLSQFGANDVPKFEKKSIKRYTIFMVIFLSLFALMWLKEVFNVVSLGDTETGSYSSTPVLFWVIRYLDLGFCIPLGFISIYMLYNYPKRFYSLILLFFGFGITMLTTVNMMGWMEFLNNNPELQISSLVVFGFLGVIVYSGYYYLIKHKLKNLKKK